MSIEEEYDYKNDHAMRRFRKFSRKIYSTEKGYNNQPYFRKSNMNNGFRKAAKGKIVNYTTQNRINEFEMPVEERNHLTWWDSTSRRSTKVYNRN